MINKYFKIARTSVVSLAVAFQMAGNLCSRASGDELADIPDVAVISAQMIANEYTKGLNQYFNLYLRMKRDVDAGREPIFRAANIIFRKPAVLKEEWLEPVLKEKSEFDHLASSLHPTTLANPLSGDIAKDMNSADPKIRDEALMKVQKKFSDYEAAIERMEEKRRAAYAISSRADASEHLLYIFEEEMSAINDSPLGVTLNAATQNRFSWLWGDLATTAFDAIGGRAGSAKGLATAYDKAVANMHHQLDAYDGVREMVALYRRQLFLSRYRVSGVDKPNAEAAKANERALEALKKANSVNRSSEYGERLNEISHDLEAKIHDTLETEKILWSSAIDANNRAATAHMFSTLFSISSAAVNLAGAVVAGSPATQNAPSASPNFVIPVPVYVVPQQPGPGPVIRPPN